MKMKTLTYKTKDRDKGITRITYNNIGLVDSILFDNGAKVLYTYGVNGEKLRVRHYAASSNVISHVSAIRPGTNTIRYSEEEYIGGELVKSGSVSGTSSTPPTYKCYFGDGYISFNSFDLSFNSDIVPEYYYYSKDHLGNVRSVVTKKESTNAVTEVQKTHYYPFGGIIADLSTGRSVQNRLYNGKELDTSNNLWWYDYGARQYDPTAPRFTTPDPLAHKYYGWNMYGYCVNNPVMMVDPDGKRPTVKEAAAMATHVYGDDDAKKVNLGNWRVSRRNFGIKLTTTNGLKSAVYEKVIKGKVTEYAYVTCGSTNVQDWIENYNQTKGCSKEYMESARNAKAISEQIGDNTELTFIGHSQGGGEAALNSLVTSNDNAKGRRAITFNAAGLSGETKYNVGGLKTLLKSNRKIDAYIMITCPLNLYQNSIGTSLPHVDGNMHFIRPKDWSSLYNGHSMINLYNSIK